MQKENDPHKLSDFIELMENSIESKKCTELEIEIDYDDIHLVQLLSVVEVEGVDEVVEGAGDQGGVAVEVQLGLLEPEGRPSSYTGAISPSWAMGLPVTSFDAMCHSGAMRVNELLSAPEEMNQTMDL